MASTRFRKCIFIFNRKKLQLNVKAVTLQSGIKCVMPLVNLQTIFNAKDLKFDKFFIIIL